MSDFESVTKLPLLPTKNYLSPSPPPTPLNGISAITGKHVAFAVQSNSSCSHPYDRSYGAIIVALKPFPLLRTCMRRVPVVIPPSKRDNTDQEDSAVADIFTQFEHAVASSIDTSSQPVSLATIYPELQLYIYG